MTSNKLINKNRSTTVRFLDQKGNKNILSLKEQYDNGLMTHINFSMFGTGSNSHIIMEENYDFQTLTRTRLVHNLKKDPNTATFVDTFIDIPQVKKEILNRFNDKTKFHMTCNKSDCNDPNCFSKLSVGGKITETKNTKAPYFSSQCNAIIYQESDEHLNTKLAVYRTVYEKQQYYAKTKSTTQIVNLELEKPFGTERKPDVYYEKHYTNKEGVLSVEKYAIEVQRSNASFDELTERTNWYKENGISVMWVIADKLFEKNNITLLEHEKFNSPLLATISHSMALYNNRFFIFDNAEKKILSLTLQNPKIAAFNNMDVSARNYVKKTTSIHNLYIVSNIPQDDNTVKLLDYKSNRDSKSKMYTDITTLGTFKDSFGISDKFWNDQKKQFQFKKFFAISQHVNKPNNVNTNSTPSNNSNQYQKKPSLHG
jgi:competence CoiA-like predicted nuclease